MTASNNITTTSNISKISNIMTDHFVSVFSNNTKKQ